MAIPISEKVRERLTEIGGQLGKSQTKIKLVEPENLHITLEFLGNIKEKQLEKAKEQLREIKKEKFEIRFTHLGVFPTPSHIKVIWAGIEQGKEDLIELHSMLSEEKYDPHVTLARVKTRPDEQLLKTLETKLDETMQVDRIHLMKSILNRQGPKYEKVFEIELD